MWQLILRRIFLTALRRKKKFQGINCSCSQQIYSELRFICAIQDNPGKAASTTDTFVLLKEVGNSSCSGDLAIESFSP